MASFKADLHSDPSRLESHAKAQSESESVPLNDLIRIPKSQRSDSVTQRGRADTSLPGFEHNSQIPLTCLEGVRGRLDDLIAKNVAVTARLTQSRETIIRELYANFAIRHVAAGQLTRPDVAEMRHRWKDTLKLRQELLNEKQEDLCCVDEALACHATFLDYSNKAFLEVFVNIRLLEANSNTEYDYVGSRYPLDFPRMTALAGLIAGEDYKSVPLATPKPTLKPEDQISTTSPRFVYLYQLPIEVRHMIWKFSLPGQRIITHSSRHNKNLSLLSACLESRSIVKSKYERILSPTYNTTTTNTEFIWVDLNNDIVVRDLATPDSDQPTKNLFDRPTNEFITGCFRVFTGLAKLKHIAVAFDVLRQNGGSFFVALQACAPELETLTIIPSTQIDGSPLKRIKVAPNDNIHLVELDSNVLDYVCFRKSWIRDRNLKQKACRGVSAIATYLNYANQYRSLFPSYVASTMGLWNPKISVCLVTTWNRRCRGWQTRHLDLDHFSGNYVGEDKKLYHGFVEAGMMCGADGEVLSRYDGIAQLFGEV